MIAVPKNAASTPPPMYVFQIGSRSPISKNTTPYAMIRIIILAKSFPSAPRYAAAITIAQPIKVIYHGAPYNFSPSFFSDIFFPPVVLEYK